MHPDNDDHILEEFGKTARQSPHWPEIRDYMKTRIAGARTPLPPSSSEIIAKFCAANHRQTYDYRSHAQSFPKAALEIALESDEGPALRASMEALIAQPDFTNKGLSMAIAMAERNLHQALIGALLAVARDLENCPPDVRLSAWDNLDAIKSARPQS